MEGEPNLEHEPRLGDVKQIEGKKHVYKDTGYTLREYYSHFTDGKGPGPGWDFITRLADDEYTLKHFGRTFSLEEVFDPALLPNTPYYRWEIDEEN
jgi:hypothetical protein